MVMHTLGIYFEGEEDGSAFPNGQFKVGSIVWYTPSVRGVGMASIDLKPTPGAIKCKIVREKDTSSPFVMDGSPLAIWLKRVPVYTPGSPSVATGLKVKDAALQLLAMKKSGYGLDDAWTELEGALRRAKIDVDAAVAAELKSNA